MPEKYGVKTGEIKIAEAPDKLTALGLGSCIATSLYDPKSKIGGLAHVMLPESRTSDPKKPGKYADTAVKELIKKLEEKDCKKKLGSEISRGCKYVFAFS